MDGNEDHVVDVDLVVDKEDDVEDEEDHVDGEEDHVNKEDLAIDEGPGRQQGGQC